MYYVFQLVSSIFFHIYRKFLEPYIRKNDLLSKLKKRIELQKPITLISNIMLYRAYSAYQFDADTGLYTIDKNRI